MHAMRRHSISITQLASFSFNLPDLRLKLLAVLFYMSAAKSFCQSPFFLKCFAKITKLAHIRMDFAGIMQTIGIKGRYVGFTYIRPLYGFAPFWRS